MLFVDLNIKEDEYFNNIGVIMEYDGIYGRPEKPHYISFGPVGQKAGPGAYSEAPWERSICLISSEVAMPSGVWPPVSLMSTPLPEEPA